MIAVSEVILNASYSQIYIIQKIQNLLVVINNDGEKIDILTIMQNHAKLLVCNV